MVNIVKQIVPENKFGIKCPHSMAPTRIVVHNTANDASARNEIAYMTNNNNEVSFHYAVDDKEIVQGIEENRNAWHSGDGNGQGNREGIAIEICYSKSGGERFTKAEDNAVDLIVDILNRYSWDIDKVTKHQDYSGKYCPHRTLDLGWNRFLERVKEKLSMTRTRPFVVGEIVYNTEDLYLHETAGYGGKEILLSKNTESVVKKYHYNNGLYMALGNSMNYYDAAWTDEYSKFTTEKPAIELLTKDNKETKEENKDTEIENNILEESSNNKENEEIKETNVESKKETSIADNNIVERENSLLWLLDKIIKFIVKLFKRKK
ncbi:MAG: N-acetylmuramoyl-L-alanine amidase family protein [Bacilli bacterium]